MPLLHEGEVIGVLHVSSDHVDSFTPFDVGLLEVVADRVALVIERTRQVEQQRVIVDTLQQSVLPEGSPTSIGS